MSDLNAGRSEKTPSILIVSGHPCDRHWLVQELRTFGWTCGIAETVGAALDALGGADATFLVICEQSLPDGDWRDLLIRTTGDTGQPLLIATSTHADDRLWVEVLNLGGFDVLMKPFDRIELCRVMQMALRHWEFRRATSVTAVEYGQG